MSDVAPDALEYVTITVTGKTGQKWSYVLSEPGASECEAHWRDEGCAVSRVVASNGDRVAAPAPPPPPARGQLVLPW